MWLWFILAFALLALLAYLYGIFTPLATYTDKLLAPRLLHFTFRGKNELLPA